MSKLRDSCRCRARYNLWANQQIIDAISHLNDAEFYEPVLPKSKAVNFLLNHVLVIDKLWISEVENAEFDVTSSVQMLHDKREDYLSDRQATDRRIVQIVDTFSEADFEAMLYCDDPGLGVKEWLAIYELDHIFRHQIHHRGQLSILLQYTSAPALKIDQLFLPEDLPDDGLPPPARQFANSAMIEERSDLGLTNEPQ